MKAQKAAAFSLLAGCIAFSFPETGSVRSAAADPQPEAVIAVDTTAADTDGNFTAAVSLKKMPETGLCALEFALQYDAAALTITDVTLLYDTGAQKAEQLAGLQKSDVFTYDNTAGKLCIRWGTAMNADYWLKEERAFISVSGTLTEEAPAGSRTELKLTPAAGDAAEAVIAAGWLDADDVLQPCMTAAENGAVWKPIDETGATMYGDMNLDGERTVEDAVLMCRVINEELALSAAAYANADCEFNGVLTIGDVSLMLRQLQGLVEDTALGAH